MKLPWGRRSEPEPEPEDRGEQAETREVGPPEPDKATVGKDPVTGRWVSRKRM